MPLPLALLLLALGLLGSPAPALASPNIELTAPPALPSCEVTSAHLQKECPITMALIRMWKKLSTQPDQQKRATQGLDAERAALKFVRDRYQSNRYQIQITNVEIEEAAGCEIAPRLVTMAVSERQGSWMTRLQLMVSEKKGEWLVKER